MPQSLTADALSGHVVVCGVNHLALRTVGELLLRGEQVALVAPIGTSVDDLGLESVPAVMGDQRVDRVLRAAGVERAAAVVFAAEDDRGNLDGALAVQSINPDARVVVRLFDSDLGRHLEGLLAHTSVLSSSALAAPGFISAAVFGDAGERFTVGGRMLVTRATPGAGMQLDALTPPQGSDLVPIARMRSDRTVEVLPSTADPRESGVVVMEILDPSTDSGAAAQRREAALAVPTPLSRIRSLPDTIRDRIAAPERRLTKAALILLGLVGLSAIFFELAAGLSPIDALSYAITLLTGASLLTSIDPDTASGWLKVYAIALSIVGAAVVAVVYAFITDAIIRSRLLQTLGRRSVPASIQDHVIICGLGTIGYRVAIGIAALGVPVVVIEPDENGRFVAAARSRDIPVVVGDARQRELLLEVGIERARAVVAATSDDLVNLSASLNARAIRPDVRIVLRLFDPDFAVRVQRGFGIRFTRSVSALAAPAFAAAALGSEVIASIPIGDRRMVLFARLPVAEGSRLAGLRMSDIDQAGQLKVLAVADRGNEVARWSLDHGSEVIDAGEYLIVAATRAGLAAVLQLARVP
jgi:Trk K+ transport system NAD-binding subunit